MSTNLLRRMRRVFMSLLALALVTASLATGMEPASAQVQTPPADGVVCTTSPNATFTLTTQTGYIGLSDDNTVFMWGYAESGKPFQHPSPVLCVNEGDTVTVILHNTLAEDVSIVFPGQGNVLANGVPVQPQFDAGGNLTSLTNVAPANGGSITYSFVAGRPGTYIYQSGTKPDKQVRMGLFGVLIVRSNRDDVANDIRYAYDTGENGYKASTEFMVLLSEIDPYLNQATERGQTFDMSMYHPRYWLINGRGFPDSIAPNFATWLPTQPYGSLARIHPYDPVNNPLPALVRYINVGTIEFPFHPHGNNSRIVGRDGYVLEDAVNGDLSFEKFSINIGPGQTWDATFSWYDAENYQPDTNPVPVTIPNIQNMVYGMFFSGSPYLGTEATLPVGTTGMTQCGEYYIIAHNHALFQLDSWGVPMTGPATFTRVDPPLPNSCPQ
ncbi:MAG: multicopper oxidase domain-containing protein [Caldilineaceae bacterium]|nr:multicopper oxidase domain-containing protein [Caldilineaceae bacterium]